MAELIVDALNRAAPNLHQPQDERSGLRAIFGRWPGDETDEEIEAALAEMERCHCGGDAEIERLRRELEDARERERALREAVLDTIRKACRCDEYYRAIEREDPQCQAHDIEARAKQVFEAAGVVGREAGAQSGG